MVLSVLIKVKMYSKHGQKPFSDFYEINMINFKRCAYFIFSSHLEGACISIVSYIKYLIIILARVVGDPIYTLVQYRAWGQYTRVSPIIYIEPRQRVALFPKLPVLLTDISTAAVSIVASEAINKPGLAPSKSLI